jgi:hypothetical protein
MCVAELKKKVVGLGMREGEVNGRRQLQIDTAACMQCNLQRLISKKGLALTEDKERCCLRDAGPEDDEDLLGVLEQLLDLGEEGACMERWRGGR